MGFLTGIRTLPPEAGDGGFISNVPKGVFVYAVVGDTHRVCLK
jgi:hypothetical protein